MRLCSCCRQRLAPRHSEIALGLGQALAASGRVEEALDAFALASALDFFAVEPVYQAGELFLRQGDAARAALHFSRAAELDAGHAEARVGLGRARLLSGDAVGAVTVLEAAVALVTILLHAGRHLGWWLLRDRPVKYEVIAVTTTQ